MPAFHDEENPYEPSNLPYEPSNLPYEPSRGRLRAEAGTRRSQSGGYVCPVCRKYTLSFWSVYLRTPLLKIECPRCYAMLRGKVPQPWLAISYVASVIGILVLLPIGILAVFRGWSGFLLLAMAVIVLVFSVLLMDFLLSWWRLELLPLDADRRRDFHWGEKEDSENAG